MRGQITRWHVRAVLAVLVLVPAGILVSGAVFGETYAFSDTAPEAEGTTVITSQSGQKSDRLVAYAPSGERIITHHKYDTYWDVDPSPIGDDTVLVTAANQRAACGSNESCTEALLFRLNISTGETQMLYTKRYPKNRRTVRWHDVDRVDEHTYAVADVAQDKVFVLNKTSGTIEWGWMVDQEYAYATGRAVSDWTHLNDVEVVNDSTLMVSLRNQDSVVFVNRERGLMQNWTLGSEDDLDTLYEQHNPDYIPRERGGPAVVVADSQNNRIVEYQRVDGSWVRSWTWRDEEMQWPRDADRLPNGNTLIGDSHGNRVIEVSEGGDIVWEVRAPSVYDVERLGTGDESQGGHSAEALNLTSKNAGASPSLFDDRFTGILNNREAAAVKFFTPPWFGVKEFLSTVWLLLIVPLWVSGELYAQPYRPTLRRKGDE